METTGEHEGAGMSGTAREPCVVGKPATSSLSLMNVGMPARGASSPTTTSVRTGSSNQWATAFRCGLAALARATAAARSSWAATSRRASRSRRSVASLVPSASSVVASTIWGRGWSLTAVTVAPHVPGRSRGGDRHSAPDPQTYLAGRTTWAGVVQATTAYRGK